MALKRPLVSGALSALVCAVFIYLTLTGPVAAAYKNYSEPLFPERAIHPQKTLSGGADYLLLMDFSDDSSLLAALTHNRGTPGVPAWDWMRNIGVAFAAENKPADPQVVLWRAPDWQRVGVIGPGQTSAPLAPLSLGAGAGGSLVAEVAPEYDRVYVRRAGDRSLVTTIDFRSPPARSPRASRTTRARSTAITSTFLSARRTAKSIS